MKKNIGTENLRILIVILSTLLALSIAALVGVLLYDRFIALHKATSSVAPDNVISPESTMSHSVVRLAATPFGSTSMSRLPTALSASAPDVMVDEAEVDSITLRLYRHRAEDSTPFRVENMFPGDTVTKKYRLEVSYRGRLSVLFRADIRNGSEKLAEVLRCRISVQNGETLYDGLVKDMSAAYMLPSSSGSTTTIEYTVTVYLETSVGNEYMSRELYADFVWWVNVNEDPPSTTVKPSEETTAPSETAGPEQTSATEPSETTEPEETGELIPPYTGESWHFCIWFWIAVASLLLNVILLWTKNRSHGNDDAEDADEKGAR